MKGEEGASDGNFVVKNKTRERFARVEFAIFEYVEAGMIEVQDIGTLAALNYFVDFDSRHGRAGYAPSRDNLCRMMRVARNRLGRSIRRLMESGIVTRETQAYKSTVYSIEDVADWKPVLHQNGATGRKAHGTKTTPQHGTKTTPQHGTKTGLLIKSLEPLEPLEPKDLESACADSTATGDRQPKAKRRDATKPKGQKQSDPRVQLAIVKFDECYRASRGGQPYAVDGWRDGKAIKSLSQAYTVAILMGMIEAYFADDSSFWAVKARTIAFFVRWLNDEAGGAAFQRISAGGPAVVEDEDEFAAADRRIAAERQRRKAYDDRRVEEKS